MKESFDPEQEIVEVRREFGKHGGVSPSIERAVRDVGLVVTKGKRIEG